MKTILPALVIVFLAPAASIAASSRGKLVIGGIAIQSTADHYHRYVKHLTVSPKRRSSPAFSGRNEQDIRRLECPLRRQIFEAMRSNRAETFRFSTLRRAQENFEMRVTAVGFMFLIEKGKRAGGVDFNYSGPTVPLAADPRHWTPLARFTHVTRPGMTAAASIDGMVRDRFRSDCLSAMQANVLFAARRAIGAMRFNKVHPNGLDIGPRTQSTTPHIREAKSTSIRDMVPGDWVYMKNKDDYGTGLRPGVPAGYWQGENAMYLGKFEVGSDRKARYRPRATKRFSGMGAYAKSEKELRALLKHAYQREMRPPRTLGWHTISDADIRWFRVDRLITGG